MQAFSTKSKQLRACHPDVAATAGGWRGHEAAYLGRPAFPIDPVDGSLPHRVALGFDDKHKVVIAVRIVAIPRPVLIAGDYVCFLEPTSHVIAVPPAQCQIQIGLSDQAELDGVIPKGLQFALHSAYRSTRS